jgi:hypothetical protein
MVSSEGIVGAWVGKFWRCNYTHRLSLNINIDKNERSKNLPMNGENMAHKRCVKTPPKRKTNFLPKTS